MIAIRSQWSDINKSYVGPDLITVSIRIDSTGCSQNQAIMVDINKIAS
jgi:hypothetical protein